MNPKPEKQFKGWGDFLLFDFGQGSNFPIKKLKAGILNIINSIQRIKIINIMKIVLATIVSNRMF